MGKAATGGEAGGDAVGPARPPPASRNGRGGVVDMAPPEKFFCWGCQVREGVRRAVLVWGGLLALLWWLGLATVSICDRVSDPLVPLRGGAGSAVR